jgi:hypothetical protein
MYNTTHAISWACSFRAASASKYELHCKEVARLGIGITAHEIKVYLSNALSALFPNLTLIPDLTALPH